MSCPLSVAVGNTVSRAVREIFQCLEKAPTYLLGLGPTPCCKCLLAL